MECTRSVANLTVESPAETWRVTLSTRNLCPRWKSVKNKCLARAAFTPSEAFNCGKNFGLHGPAPPLWMPCWARAWQTCLVKSWAAKGGTGKEVFPIDVRVVYTFLA